MFRAASPPVTDQHLAARRGLLRADGVVVLVGGLLVLLFGRRLAEAMGWPATGTLIVLGIILLIYGAGLLAVVAVRPVSRGFTLAVALLNNLWFDACLVIAAIGPAGLTPTGRVVLLVTGGVAMVFAVAQVMAVRQR